MRACHSGREIRLLMDLAGTTNCCDGCAAHPAASRPISGPIKPTTLAMRQGAARPGRRAAGADMRRARELVHQMAPTGCGCAQEAPPALDVIGNGRSSGADAGAALHPLRQILATEVHASAAQLAR